MVGGGLFGFLWWGFGVGLVGKGWFGEGGRYGFGLGVGLGIGFSGGMLIKRIGFLEGFGVGRGELDFL